MSDSTSIDLHAFRTNMHSQFGEDGILDKLFGELSITNGTFCEFGAWDGQHLSNTRALFERGWSGIYIEGDEARFGDLERNVKSDRAELLRAFVQPDGADSLDDLLGRSMLLAKRGLDFLSIDSDDLAVWKGLTRIRPLVVCIEFNPTIPLDVEYTNPHGQNKGNLAAAIGRYAREHGYDLVATTSCNLIFIDAPRRPKRIPVRALSIEQLPQQWRYFWGYDGTLIVARTADACTEAEFSAPEVVGIPWKTAVFAQPTPAVFRRFDQGTLRDSLFRAYSLASATLTHPISTLRFAARRLSGRR